MPNYNQTLQTNNSSLEEIITQLNNMPDFGQVASFTMMKNSLLCTYGSFMRVDSSNMLELLDDGSFTVYFVSGGYINRNNVIEYNIMNDLLTQTRQNVLK